LFRHALISPTENAVAQATWADSAAGLDVTDECHLVLPHSNEARARDAARIGEWRRAITESAVWLVDQPFSVTAAAFATYAASMGAMDYRLGEELARMGLSANPSNALLRNNLAF